MSYKVKWETTGFLKRRRVRVTHMPRATFMGLVKKALDSDEDFKPIRKPMLETARGMSRFPMSTWLDVERGCGCVVGEYLVATQEVEAYNDQIIRRKATVQEYDKLESQGIEGVDVMLARREHGPALYEFGSKIDDVISNHLDKEGVRDRHGNDERPVVVIIDDDA